LGEAEAAKQRALLDIGVLDAASRHDGDAPPEDTPADLDAEGGDAVAGAAVLHGRAGDGAGEEDGGKDGPGAEAGQTPAGAEDDHGDEGAGGEHGGADGAADALGGDPAGIELAEGMLCLTVGPVPIDARIEARLEG